MYISIAPHYFILFHGYLELPIFISTLEMGSSLTFLHDTHVGIVYMITMATEPATEGSNHRYHSNQEK